MWVMIFFGANKLYSKNLKRKSTRINRVNHSLIEHLSQLIITTELSKEMFSEKNSVPKIFHKIENEIDTI